MLNSKPYHHGDLRNALISAGREALKELPIEEISLREIARRVGVSHAAPYRHFPSSEHLFAEVAILGFKELSEEIGSRTGDDAVDIYIDFARRNESLALLMFVPRSWNKGAVIHPGIEGMMLKIGSRIGLKAWVSAHGAVMLNLQGFYRSTLAIAAE